MTTRRTTAVTALALGLVLGPAAASLAQGTYPPPPPPGVSPTVQPTPPSGVSPGAEVDDEDDVLGAILPRTGAGIAAAGAAGVALVGGGALLVAGARRRGQQS